MTYKVVLKVLLIDRQNVLVRTTRRGESSFQNYVEQKNDIQLLKQ